MYLLKDDPMRKVEFIVRDNEDNPLKNAKVIIKSGKIPIDEMTTDDSGKCEMTKEVYLGKLLQNEERLTHVTLFIWL